MPEVIVNDITVHFERTGSGPPLLLLHGLGSSSDDWEYQVRDLSEDHLLILPDFRGHGQSSKPQGPYSIEELASDIAALEDGLGLGPAPVVGISLGGMVGFQLAADRPDLVDRLIAVNALPAFETKRVSQRIQVAIRKVITKRLTMDKIGDVISKRLLPEDDMADKRATMVERWARNDKPAYQASFDAILAWEGVADAMATTEVPITVISSELDYIGVEDKQPYIDAMPTANMVVIEGAHHGVPFEYPERFNQTLIEVLG